MAVGAFLAADPARRCLCVLQPPCRPSHRHSTQVGGSYVEEEPSSLIACNPNFFERFALVIGTQVRHGRGHVRIVLIPFVGGAGRLQGAGRLACQQNSRGGVECLIFCTLKYALAIFLQLPEPEAAALDRICRGAGVPLLLARSYGE